MEGVPLVHALVQDTVHRQTREGAKRLVEGTVGVEQPFVFVTLKITFNLLKPTGNLTYHKV